MSGPRFIQDALDVPSEEAMRHLSVTVANATRPLPAPRALLCIDLPLPPSVNELTVNLKGGGRAKSQVYKRWIEEARWHVMMAWRAAGKPTWPADCPMSIRIEAGLEGRRKDLGNIEKATSDLLVANLPIPDDKYFDRILIERREDIPGIARVTVSALEQGGSG